MQNIMGSRSLFNRAGKVNSNKKAIRKTDSFSSSKCITETPISLRNVRENTHFSEFHPCVLMLKYLDLKFASQSVPPKYQFCFCPRTHTYLPHHG